jgi:hypothetical protein
MAQSCVDLPKSVGPWRCVLCTSRRVELLMDYPTLTLVCVCVCVSVSE